MSGGAKDSAEPDQDQAGREAEVSSPGIYRVHYILNAMPELPDEVPAAALLPRAQSL